MQDFLQLSGKAILVLGAANKRSVAWHIGRVLTAAGARVIHSVRSPERREAIARLAPELPVLVCDVERPEEIARLRGEVAALVPALHGLVHSIAWADYSEGIRPFHATPKQAFLRSVDISCYSLVALAEAFRELLDRDASVVAVSISDTRMASENYGYMGPIKAALDASLAYLTKSFSRFSRVRFNAVAPGLLKTSASAGIPGYLESYLYAEAVIPRKAAVTTDEVANAAAFLLSPRASGITAQSLVIDAGMSINYFDREVIARATREGPPG